MGRWWTAFWQRRRAARWHRLRELALQSRSAVGAFTVGREPQADAEFVAACPGGNVERGRWLLAARWAVARLSRVRPELIHASDRLAHLMTLPGWPSDCTGLDVFPLVFLVELATGLTMSDREWKRVRVPNPDEPMSVGEFAASVAAACERFLRSTREAQVAEKPASAERGRN